LKLESLYRYLPKNRQELIERVAEYRRFYNVERVHESLDYRTPASVYLANIAVSSSNLNAG
jgi:putative transposase